MPTNQRNLKKASFSKIAFMNTIVANAAFFFVFILGSKKDKKTTTFSCQALYDTQ